MAKGVKPLKSKRRVFNPITRDGDLATNSDKRAHRQLAADQKKVIRTGKSGTFKGSPSGGNSTYQ